MNNYTPKRIDKIAYITDDARWQAVIERDRNADGQFFYAISTTKIYCYPSCPSRLALRRHTLFFENATRAELAGFRPCKR